MKRSNNPTIELASVVVFAHDDDEGGGEGGGNEGGGGAEIDFSGQFFEDRVSRQRRRSTDATAAPPRLAGRGRSDGVIGLGLAVDRGSCSKRGQITCLWGECTCRRKARPSQGTGLATIH